MIFLLTAFGCQQSIESSDIKRKNGLYINAKTDKPLNGKYNSISPIGGSYSGNQELYFEYNEGVPIGEWADIFNGDSIHSGKYIKEPSIQTILKTITNSKRVDLDLWEEGEYPILTVDLIESKKIDTAILKELEVIIKDSLATKYEFNRIYIESINDQNDTTLAEINLQEKLPLTSAIPNAKNPTNRNSPTHKTPNLRFALSGNN